MQKKINRHLAQQIQAMLQEWPVIMVTGPRRIGKSTLIEELVQIPHLSKRTFDVEQIRDLAKSNPVSFLESQTTPLFIDEVQKAPSIFDSLKIMVDSHKNESGLYILSGSQKYSLMRGVKESLGGRVGVVEMQCLSQSEINNFDNFHITQHFGKLEERYQKYKKHSPINIYQRIIKGSMPEIINGKYSDISKYYQSYVTTVLFKDIREDIVRISSENKFRLFLKVLANYSGNTINKHNLSRDVGIDWKTCDEWLHALESIGVIFYTHPYLNNTISKIVKSPVLYFYDTGLLCHLLSIKDTSTLINFNSLGRIFETFIVSEIKKSFINSNEEIELYYLRDSNNQMREIDLIIEYDNVVYPIEIKNAEKSDKNQFNNFDLLKTIKNKKVAHMVIINNSLGVMKFDNNRIIFPAWLL